MEVALEILQSLGSKPVATLGSGPWGEAYTPVLPVVLIDECLRKLGRPVAVDRVRFEFGKPILKTEENVVMAAENGGIWIATPGELVYCERGQWPPTWRCATSSAMESEVTSVCVGPGTVWVGTSRDGLFEFDRNKRSFRQFKMKDGLLLDSVSA